MKILVINSGSSSVKFQLFAMHDESTLAWGIAERIGLKNPCFHYHVPGKDKATRTRDHLTYTEAFKLIVDFLQDPEHGVIKNLDEIRAVGHRVVHGGEDVSQPVLIDERIKGIIKNCSRLAPLHNPPNYEGIIAAETILPRSIAQVAVFDTAFFQSLPPSAYLYALPYDLYKKAGIRRYGFHGTSHRYVAHQAGNLLNKPFNALRMITCHLGNGCSMAAIDRGNPVDTSMGLTPLEGLVMGTRSGDIDPAIILHLMENEGLTYSDIYTLLNKKSGLLGIAGIGSSDFRDILHAAQEGNAQAQTAIDLFIYKIKKYIGAYYGILGGLDVLVFTAGIGENSSYLREHVCRSLECLGIRLDRTLNSSRETIISKADSTVTVMVIPTNEELMIARDTIEVIAARSS